MLWGGDVAKPNSDAPTRGILEFNEKVMGGPAFFGAILPIRDGLCVAVRR
ncbi:MAG: hypothetical protein M5R36_14400 [Deltaproteobacteria bacterium]|nr:hypothetical protein [Deltaproteobacteria bacterium]